MTSIIANGGNDTPSYPTVSVGVQKARCVRVIDLGTQQNDYQGQISWKRQVMLIWEVPSETDNKGEPLTISKFYTLSLNEKANLANDLVSWRGRPFTETEKKAFDISKLEIREILRSLAGRCGSNSSNYVNVRVGTAAKFYQVALSS